MGLCIGQQAAHALARLQPPQDFAVLLAAVHYVAKRPQPAEALVGFIVPVGAGILVHTGVHYRVILPPVLRGKLVQRVFRLQKLQDAAALLGNGGSRRFGVVERAVERISLVLPDRFVVGQGADFADYRGRFPLGAGDNPARRLELRRLRTVVRRLRPAPRERGAQEQTDGCFRGKCLCFQDNRVLSLV